MNEEFQQAPEKPKNNLSALYLGIAAAVGIFFGYMVSINTVNKPSVFSSFEYNKINDILNYIDRFYVDSVDMSDIEEQTINELLANLDPHSYYIPAAESQGIEEEMQGNFEGIGVQFLIKKDTIFIEETIKDGPSEKVGVQAGDKIIYVEDSLVAGIGIANEDVMKLLKGPGGTKVKISVLRNSKILDFTITRGKIPLYSVDIAYMLTPNTGYIKINRFAATTYDEFVESFEKLESQGLSNLVLDLRGNPGGYLQTAVEIADEFLEGKKLVVYTEGLHQDKYEYSTNKLGLFEKGKLVILIDENSASASEILAGAIQDWDRGTIIGRRSFGKGLVQDQFELPDKSALRLTIARYYTPSGRSIQKPYDDIHDYYAEVDERYYSGELLTDSLKLGQEDKPYYTLIKKREVFAGGGIAPDVIVPLDTSYANMYVAVLRQYVQGFTSSYVENNKDSFAKYNVDTFAKVYTIDENLLQAFYKYAKSEGYKDAISSNPIYISGLKLSLKSSLAKKLYDNEGFYKVVNANELIIKEALKTLSK